MRSGAFQNADDKHVASALQITYLQSYQPTTSQWQPNHTK